MTEDEIVLLRQKLVLKAMELEIRRDELNFEIKRDLRYQESHEAKKRNLSYEFNPKNLEENDKPKSNLRFGTRHS